MNQLSAEGVVLVAYDGSPHSEAALEWAAATATLEGRSVRAVSVAEPRASADRDVDDDSQRRFEAVLAAAGADGTFEELAGDVEAVLLERSRHAHVLVAGTRGRGRTANTLLGSVSQHLARHTPCPLIVVRPPANPASARIVAGVDGSLQSIAALRFACHRASFTKEAVVALHAWKPGHVDLDYSGQLPEAVGQRFEAAEALLDECIAEVRAEYPDVALEPDSVPSPPTKALTDASAYASLVVTGSRGRGVVAGLVLGSVSQHVLNHAQSPVAVTR
jgi:nucleotide-binding universal stress UspA family protein